MTSRSSSRPTTRSTETTAPDEEVEAHKFSPPEDKFDKFDKFSPPDDKFDKFQTPESDDDVEAHKF